MKANRGSFRQEILGRVYQMKPGDFIQIDLRTVADEFPPLNIFDDGTIVERFLSRCIGSASGAVRAEMHGNGRALIVSRHEESDKRYYVDPDRNHLFDKRADGTLKLRLPLTPDGRPTPATSQIPDK